MSRHTPSEKHDHRTATYEIDVGIQQSEKTTQLSYGFVPRGVSRAVAAEYLGIGTSLFDELVADGRMPKPKMVNTRTVWDRLALDQAFDELPTKGMINLWDQAYG